MLNLKSVAYGVVAVSGAILAKMALDNIAENRKDKEQHYGSPCYNPTMVKTPSESEIFSSENPYIED